jgi:hypothetical protein
MLATRYNNSMDTTGRVELSKFVKIASPTLRGADTVAEAGWVEASLAVVDSALVEDSLAGGATVEDMVVVLDTEEADMVRDQAWVRAQALVLALVPALVPALATAPKAPTPKIHSPTSQHLVENAALLSLFAT